MSTFLGVLGALFRFAPFQREGMRGPGRKAGASAVGESPGQIPGLLFCQKKPRRLSRGSCSVEDSHRPDEMGDACAQRYLTTSRQAEQINFRLWAASVG